MAEGTGLRAHTVNALATAKVVLLAGPIGVGKTTVADELERRFGATVVRARDAIETAAAKQEMTRYELQAFGAQLEVETSGRWLAEYVDALVSDSRRIVLDSVRQPMQAQEMMSRAWAAVIVYLHARPDVRQSRYELSAAGGDRVKAQVSLHEAEGHPAEEEAATAMRDIAHHVIDTSHQDAPTTARQVARAAGWSPPEPFGS